MSRVSGPSNQSPIIPFRQLDQGTFDVRSRLRSSGTTSMAGHVFVEEISGSVKVEHWALSPIYESPDNSQDMLVERRGQSHGSLAAFLSEMANLETQGGFSFTYIRAECETFASLPSS